MEQPKPGKQKQHSQLRFTAWRPGQFQIQPLKSCVLLFQNCQRTAYKTEKLSVFKGEKEMEDFSFTIMHH